MRKRKWMKAGACALSAVLIMGLYAGPAFAEWKSVPEGTLPRRERAAGNVAFPRL